MTVPNALMIGTGQYTTGLVHGPAGPSDKTAGVVALTLFDLRRRGKVGRLLMAGTDGRRFPAIRRHFEQVLAGQYRDLDIRFDSFPDDDVARDPTAYRRALEQLAPGDLVTIFTPDDTHFAIAMDAIRRGCHVLVAKPAVKTVAEHQQLVEAAAECSVLAAVEMHKRWDPIYVDARDRIRQLGGLSFFQAYMSQPKTQLEMFRAWAGTSSDISYYLNSHHIDFSIWAAGSLARPVSVSAVASTGVALSRGIQTEDVITLVVQWENFSDGSLGTAVYTASWVAPPSDVHSQQRFFCQGHAGELQVDQAHRGYSLATDQQGYCSPNPLFMKYTPDSEGRFAGQTGYGYRSIEAFVDAVLQIRDGRATPAEFNGQLATLADTVQVTAILEAGRRSLDSGGARWQIQYDGTGHITGLVKDPRR